MSGCADPVGRPQVGRGDQGRFSVCFWRGHLRGTSSERGREAPRDSRTAQAQRILAEHADAVLYQAELELVWFRDGEQLRVIDLRGDGASVHVIARGMPDQHRLLVARDDEIADPNDG